MKTTQKWTKMFFLGGFGKVVSRVALSKAVILMAAVACFGALFTSCNAEAIKEEIFAAVGITYSVTQVGRQPGGTEESTGIKLTFKADVPDLTDGDIEIEGPVTRGSLSGSGKSWTIALSSVAESGEVTVSVDKPGVDATAKRTRVYKEGDSNGTGGNDSETGGNGNETGGGETGDSGSGTGGSGTGNDGNGTGGSGNATAQHDLRTRFGVIATGTDGVRETFLQLHNRMKPPTNSTTIDLTTFVNLGDWIDLSSLVVVSAGGTNGGAINATTNTDLGAHGKLLRLIVVGIDSFLGVNGNSTHHIVFQFQNIPGTLRMEAADTNENGYLGSEMRKYLTRVDASHPLGEEGSGKFLDGLIAAGVNESYIWAPSRRVAHTGLLNASVDTIADKVWLPTVWELFGAQGGSVASCETANNQARLEYYMSPNNGSRAKYNAGNEATPYWEASPYATYQGDPDHANSFSVVDSLSPDSAGGGQNASAVRGIAPAFCFKY
jgi:hypothetical protein